MWIRQNRSVGVVGLAVLGLLAWQGARACSAGTVGAGKSADPRNAPASSDEQRHIEDVSRRIFAITDIVLERHIEPATRQEMILGGLKAAIAAKKLTMPDLSRRVSNLKKQEELTELLNELWPRLTKDRPTGAGGVKQPSTSELERAIFDGLLRPVLGHAYFLPAKEARVQAQVQANRYIGIGIALGMDKKSELPQIKMVQAGGPARLGGVRAGDLIEEINHVRVAPHAPIREVVDQLRGPEGSELTIRVRQPDAKESRTLALVRLPVMFKSVKCSAENADEDRVVLLNAKPAIAYLRIDSITASTARELASWEPRLREAGVEGLVLDLRETGGSASFDSYHSAVLLADSLLDGKPLGKLLTRDGSRQFAADRDCLFRDWPLAVLIDENTSGPAAWVVAALQDADPPGQKRRRAVVVGTSHEGAVDNFVRSAVLLPGGEESLILATAAWERPKAQRPHEETVPLDARYEWRVVPDLVYGDETASVDVAKSVLAVLAQSALPASAKAPTVQTAGKIVKRPVKPGASSGSSAGAVTPATVSSQDVGNRYKQVAIAAIRKQLELAGKSGQ